MSELQCLDFELSRPGRLEIFKGAEGLIAAIAGGRALARWPFEFSGREKRTEGQGRAGHQGSRAPLLRPAPGR